jgi:hypothetical protein
LTLTREIDSFDRIKTTDDDEKETDEANVFSLLILETLLTGWDEPCKIFVSLNVATESDWLDFWKNGIL